MESVAPSLKTCDRWISKKATTTITRTMKGKRTANLLAQPALPSLLRILQLLNQQVQVMWGCQQLQREEQV